MLSRWQVDGRGVVRERECLRQKQQTWRALQSPSQHRCHGGRMVHVLVHEQNATRRQTQKRRQLVSFYW